MRATVQICSYFDKKNRTFERPRSGWEDNIKTDLQEVGRGGGGMDWYDLVHDRDR